MFYRNKLQILIVIASIFFIKTFGFAQSSTIGNPKNPPFDNPIFDSDFPDPTVIRASDGFYYAYATQTQSDGNWTNIQVARSSNLIAWKRLDDALPVKPVWANQTQNFWAPHVIQVGKIYFMYYSAAPNNGNGMCLAVATATSPAGKFTDRGAPLKCGDGFINIDPMAFDDPQTGKHFLYWGSGFQSIKVQELASDRMSFAPNSKPIDLIFPNSKPNSANYRNLVEGVWITYRRGFYYLFFSGDDCCGVDAHYAVMEARSDSPTGAFQIYPKNNGVIIESNEKWLAPGHNSVVRDGKSNDWIVYHAFHAKNRQRGRVMLMNALTYDRDGWAIIKNN